MIENRVAKSSYQVAFIKLILGLIIWKALEWFFSFWIVGPLAYALSFLITAILGYFYLPGLRKLGFFKWTTTVVLISGCFIGLYFGNSVFGENRLWLGSVLGVSGILYFISNWIYLRVMSGGAEIDSTNDIITPRTWLILNGILGVAMIVSGIFFALGAFD